jgi:hypothetical protein
MAMALVSLTWGIQGHPSCIHKQVNPLQFWFKCCKIVEILFDFVEIKDPTVRLPLLSVTENDVDQEV